MLPHFSKIRSLIYGMLVLPLLTLVPPAPAHAAAATSSDWAPNSESGVLIDLQTGQLLWSKNPHQREFPASITKILTADLALEHSHLNDPVIVPHEAPLADGNRVYLLEGESLSMEQMLYGLLINSGNDAAIAIADHISGSVSQFADLMNQKARSLGATDSHFVTPNGLHDDNHYTSAYDMALIARDAMKNQTFRNMVGTKNYQWHSKGWDSNLVNLNQMLWTYEGATGIKTGFTDQAQQTIVVSATRGNRQLLAVLMHAKTKNVIHEDAARVLDNGFSQFTTKNFGSAGDLLSAQGHRMVLQNTLSYDVKIDDMEPFQTKIDYSPPKPPYDKGARVGTLTIWHNNVAILKSDLLAEAAQQAPVSAQLAAPSFWIKYLPLLLVVLGFLLLLGYSPKLNVPTNENRQSEL